jgi:hypothetical protein
MFYSFIVAVSLSVVLLVSGASCKDPEEYNPETPKVPPPNPPQIIFPLADTVICDNGVLFNYTVPAGSQVFQIQADTLSSFSTAEMFLRYGSFYYIALPFYHGRTTWWARVRAGSADWNNYTAWSDPRRFYLWAER